MTGLQLTRRQYYALCTMVLLSPLLHLVPRKTTAEAGCGGWLCALAALVPLLLFAWMLEGILHRGRPGEGIGEITLRATPGSSCAVTGSRFFTFSPGAANTSTSTSTSISSGRKISEGRKSAFVLPSAPQTAMAKIVTTNGHGRLSGNTVSMNRSAPMRSANAL